MSDQNPENPGGPESGWKPPAVPGEDTEGQGMKWSNRDLKKDVKPIEPRPGEHKKDDKPAEDTEGQGLKWG